jgi:hypothetical protein
MNILLGYLNNNRKGCCIRLFSYQKRTLLNSKLLVFLINPELNTPSLI